jgi:Phytanoyl-CoA dioxygenase (PhyH)
MAKIIEDHAKTFGPPATGNLESGDLPARTPSLKYSGGLLPQHPQAPCFMSPLQRIRKQPSLAYYFAQKGIRVAPARQALACLVAACMRLWGPRLSPAIGSEGLRMAGDLAAKGFAALPDQSLSAALVAQVRSELATRPLHDYYHFEKLYTLDAIPASVVKARYAPEDVLACRPLMDLANDPDVLNAIARRLGAVPTLASAEAWWTFGENNQAAEHAFDDIYHRDADDLRFVKMFVYLTDTTPRSGAHRFVLGSHTDQRFARRGAISEGEVEGAYAPEQMLTVTGKAGTAFLEDTWGIHRALLATEGRRLIFSATYALAARMPFSPQKPLLPLPAGYNRHVNRRLYY